MDAASPEHPAVARAWERLQTLGEVSDEPGRLTRVFLSDGSARAGKLIAGWMADAGLETAHDALGNLRGRHRPEGAAGRPLLLGSHLDTVVNAGKYDGALGIIAAIAALEWLAEDGGMPRKPVDILAFADEEGVRFHATYLGSRACTGTLDEALSNVRDAAGISVAEAIRDEGWHEGEEQILYRPGDAAAYLEIHIEQGRVLEENGIALGVVPSICGQTRGVVTMRGLAEHAGTTPMPLRRDALAGAAECVLAIESLALARPPLVATVGRMETLPGAGNAVPGETRFTIDARHPDDAARRRAADDIREACDAIAKRRNLELTFDIIQESAAIQCDKTWTQRCLDAARAVSGSEVPPIPSGAGHDAVVFSEVAPVAMLFVRCRGGLSHHPDESITREDLALAVSATAACISAWDSEPPSSP